MKIRKHSALILAAALTLGAAAPLALADEDSVTPSAVSTINAESKGKLVVHKYKQPENATGLENDGREIRPEQLSSLEALDGVNFKIQKLSAIDLTTLDGWQKYAELAEKAKSSDAKTVATQNGLEGSASSKKTSDGGVATFDELELGVYLVEEDPAGSDASVKGRVTPIKPFLVSVPLTNPESKDSWMYTVNVYPKNALPEAEKSVKDDTTYKIGDKLTYTIDTDIPDTDDLSVYKIVDRYDTEHLEGVNVKSVEIVGKGEQTLTADSDYKVTDTAYNGKPQVVVDFANGLAKLKQARKAGDKTTKVRVTIEATVSSLGDNGQISNQAFLIPNDSTSETDENPGTPTNTVVSKFGKIQITKVGEDSAKLDGAVFEVHKCKVSNEEIAKINTAEALVDTNYKAAKADKVDPEALVTTAPTVGGVTNVSGLRYNDWKNQSKVSEGQIDLTNPDQYGEYNAYCLIEKTAPNGYELLPAPAPFVISKNTMTNAEAATLKFNIKNVKKNGGFDLPLTGGNGIAAAGIAGGLLMAGGTFLALRRRRDTK